MKKVIIIIERSKDFYWAYAQNVEGVSGGGATVAEAKKNALFGLELQKELGNIPNVKYAITYKFDTQSLLNYYNKIISNAGMERLTGINQKQIQHYATGLKKPRQAQVKKIKTALHTLGKELMAVEL